MSFKNEFSFDEIKKNYTSTSQINQLNEDGNSIFTLFLEQYYQKLNTLSDSEKAKIINDDVQDRPIIKEIIEYFFEHHVDVNSFEEISKNSKPPLAVAVENGDYEMVKILLTNNACPNLYTKKVVFNDNVFYTNRLLDYVKQEINRGKEMPNKEIKKILLHFGAHEEI